MKIWDAVTGVDLITLTGHEGAVYACDVSSDGAYIVSASLDRTIRLWSAATGMELAVLSKEGIAEGRFVRTYTGYRGLAGFSFSKEIGVYECRFVCANSRILTASDKEIKLWDVHSGELSSLLATREEDQWSIAISDDGSTIAICSSDQVRVLDLETGDTKRLLTTHGATTSACALSHDGSNLLWLCADNELFLCDLSRDESPGIFCRLEPGGSYGVHSFAFSPDCTRIVTNGWARGWLWDAHSGREIATIGEGGSLRTTNFSADSTRVVTQTSEMVLDLWDTLSGEPPSHYAISGITGSLISTLRGHVGLITCWAFSPDGHYLVSASEDRTLKLWDVGASTASDQTTEQRYASEVTVCAFSPDGRFVASGDSGGVIALWDWQGGGQPRFVEGQSLHSHRRINSLAFSPDGRRLLSASDGALVISDVETGLGLAELYPDENTEYGERESVSFAECSFSPDGKRVLAYCNWSLMWTSSAQVLWEDDCGSMPRPSNLPDSHYWSLAIWDAGDGSFIARFPLNCHETVRGSFSPDGRFVAFPNADVVELRDARTGERVRNFSVHSGQVDSCAFSPDGKRLAAKADDGLIRMWDIHTGSEATLPEGNDRDEYECCFLPDGSLVRTQVVRPQRSGECEHEYASLNVGRVVRSRFSLGECTDLLSPDGTLVLTITKQETLEVHSGQPGAEECQYWAQGLGDARAWNPDSSRISVGASGGKFYLLEICGIQRPLPVVTVWGSQTDARYSLGCPLCRTWSEVPASVLGAELDCPACAGRLRLNRFAIDADWRPIAQASRGKTSSLPARRV